MTGGVVHTSRSVRAHYLGVLGLSGLLLIGGTYGVTMAAGAAAGQVWFLGTGLVLGYELGFGWYQLNRSPRGDSMETGLGLANWITLIRGGLFASTAGFILVPPTVPVIRWLPGVCYGMGVVLDFGDGYIARRTNTESELGRKLDHSFDTLGFLVAPLVGVIWGRLPLVYLSLSAARYLFRAGIAWRSYRGRPVGSLPDSDLRRWLAAFQMGVITVALVPVLPATIVHPAAIIALVPSLVVFVRDWVAVSTGLPGREE